MNPNKNEDFRKSKPPCFIVFLIVLVIISAVVVLLFSGAIYYGTQDMDGYGADELRMYAAAAWMFWVIFAIVPIIIIISWLLRNKNVKEK